jgi:hypothetical protein
MALSLLQSSFQTLGGVFPSFDLDFPMSDDAQIRRGALPFECDLDLMICYPLPQTFKANP